MSQEIVNLSGVKKSLVVEIPSEELEREIDIIARNYAQRVKVPGFRPGKVPLNIVRQRFGTELRNDATQDIIRRCWQNAVEEHKLSPLAEPAVEDLKAEPGEALKFSLIFEVLPSLEVKDYKAVPVVLESVAIEDKDVEAALESLRERNARYIPAVAHEIEDGQTVTLTVDGIFEDGTKPIKDEEVTFEVGGADTHETFSENLRGARMGEIRSFDVTYAADYPRKGFAGKLVHYTVKVKETRTKELPELNDEFAIGLGAESLQKLRDALREEMVTKAERAAEKKAREAAIAEIVRRNPCEVPDCLVQEELQNHARRIATSLARQGIDVGKTSLDWKKIFEKERPAAEESVRRSIILDLIARQENIEVSEGELTAEFETLAAGTGKSAAALRAQFEKDDRIQGFKEHLRQNKALDFTYRNATISRG